MSPQKEMHHIGDVEGILPQVFVNLGVLNPGLLSSKSYNNRNKVFQTKLQVHVTGYILFLLPPYTPAEEQLRPEVVIHYGEIVFPSV